ncbi:hypothetical protein KH5_11250 [Urechidicola sp. KH5]
MRSLLLYLVCFGLLISCSSNAKKPESPYILVLGIAQDAGYPQINCEKKCCKSVYKFPSHKRMVSSLALVDPISNKEWVFDATPDFSEQLKLLNNATGKSADLPEGIFLTHAHMGHYTGLMYVGREAMSSESLDVYAMPRLKNYLETNGPWSQLVTLDNIELKELQQMRPVKLADGITVTPIEVPHRDEFSETVGYLIAANSKQVLFIPDIDKWHLWEHSLVDLVQQVDYAFLDATFYKDGEINRPMSEVPHPFVEESMDLLKNLSDEHKNKVHFTHMNHSNPLLLKGSAAQKEVKSQGFQIAREGVKYAL